MNRVSALVLLSAATACAAAGVQRELTWTLAEETQLAAFDCTDRAAFRCAGGALELFAAAKYTPPHRSPLALAILRDLELGDGELAVEAQQTGPRVSGLLRLGRTAGGHLFSALLCYEVGKSWAEAEADTAEAIDFLDYYAGKMLRLAQPQPVTPVRGEQNRMIYIPLGVGVVIPPWNFPLAIMAGMTSAALLAGNTVVLKPASQSPAIASMWVDLMHECGLPKQVLNFVTGPGHADRLVPCGARGVGS
jgi:hypothetical protein